MTTARRRAATRSTRPGSSSTRRPRHETEAFVDEIERLVDEHEIDVVVPAFEEVFFLSSQRDRLSRSTTIFGAQFQALARLHDKAAFERLVRHLGLPIPESVVATSDAELAEAIGRFDRYFGRAVFSRGGVDLLTNTGPLAGVLDPADVHPTPAEPWLIQPFVEGETVCTYSTVHEGKVSSHLMYRIPAPVASLDRDPVRVGRRERVAAADRAGRCRARLHGPDLVRLPGHRRWPQLRRVQPASDRRRAAARRPTEIAAGLLEPGPTPSSSTPGKTTQLDLALVGDAFADRMERFPQTIRDLARFKDAGDGWHDPLPTLYSAFSLAHFAGVSHRDHAKLQDAMDADMSWDGEPIEGMSDADAKLLAELRDG